MLTTVIIPELLMEVSVGGFGCNEPEHKFRYLGMTTKSQSSLHDKIEKISSLSELQQLPYFVKPGANSIPKEAFTYCYF